VGVVTNAATKGNWEGTGVEPDVKVEAARALEEARRIALRKMIGAARDEERRGALLRELEALGGKP
jgi:C-terminal processing protease CtpA/Prc